MLKNILKYGLPLVAAGLLMWWTLQGIDVAAMIDKFANANYGWIFLSGLLTIVAHWSRAVRWKMLLEPMGYRPSTLNTTLAVFTGYFANYLLPRMGEVTRCGSILKTDDVPMDKSLGTVVAERVFDVISLLILIALNLFLEFDRLSQFFKDSFLSSKGEPRNPLILWILGLVFLGGLAFLGLFLGNKNFREKILSIGFAKKIYDFVLGLLDGLLSIRRLKSPALFIFHTVLIWTMYYFMAYVLFFAIPETSNMGLLSGLTVLVVGALGMTAPTQGGIGPYHFLVGNALVLYGLTQNDGIILATFIHGSQMLVILLLGALAFLGMLFIEKKKA